MKKADFIVIAVVLAVVGVLVFWLYFIHGDSGKYIQVEQDGKIVEILALDKDTEKHYDFNGDENTLVIKDGKATVTDANCPDKICVNHKAVWRSGESIICLPHKVVFTVVDDSGDNEIDAVA